MSKLPFEVVNLIFEELSSDFQVTHQEVLDHQRCVLPLMQPLDFAQHLLSVNSITLAHRVTDFSKSRLGSFTVIYLSIILQFESKSSFNLWVIRKPQRLELYRSALGR
jgi:hypothetical protein